MTGPILYARGVVKSYGATPALRGVTVEFAHGETVALTGASGSGKSTMLHCLAGIIQPEAGEVHFAGERIDNASEDKRSTLRRTMFGVLFQFGQLLPELTAAENVALPLLLDGKKRRESVTAARHWLDRFEVGDLANQRPGHMSGGQAQRVAMARALVTEPRVVFADEPTGALDSLSSERVLTALLTVAKEAKTTVVLVTHDATVAAYADREITLCDGQLETMELAA